MYSAGRSFRNDVGDWHGGEEEHDDEGEEEPGRQNGSEDGEWEPSSFVQTLDESELLADMDRVKQEAYDACMADMESHLTRFLRDRGNFTSYEDWIEDLHPESKGRRGWRVVDHRYYLEGSDHRRAWNARVGFARAVAAVEASGGSMAHMCSGRPRAALGRPGPAASTVAAMTAGRSVSWQPQGSVPSALWARSPSPDLARTRAGALSSLAQPSLVHQRQQQQQVLASPRPSLLVNQFRATLPSRSNAVACGQRGRDPPSMHNLAWMSVDVPNVAGRVPRSWPSGRAAAPPPTSWGQRPSFHPQRPISFSPSPRPSSVLQEQRLRLGQSPPQRQRPSVVVNVEHLRAVSPFGPTRVYSKTSRQSSCAPLARASPQVNSPLPYGARALQMAGSPGAPPTPFMPPPSWIIG